MPRFDTASGPISVLVAEDNPHHQILTLRLLSRLGLGADLVEDGVSVLGAIKRKRYHVVLLDLNMPLMSGFEVARAIVKDYPRTQRPFMIAVTANTEPKAREKCLEAGMDEYLPKPISLEDLRTALGGFGLVLQDEATPATSGTTASTLPPDMQNRLETLTSETDPEFVKELIATFVDQGRPDLAEIERAIRARDWDSLKRTAHGLKGASLNLGADELAKILEGIEAIAASHRDEESINTKRLTELFERAVADLATFTSA